MTEVGQAAGIITPAGIVDFKLSLRPPEAAASQLNARSFSLRTVGLSGSTVVGLEHHGSLAVIEGHALLSLRVSAVKEAYPRPRYSPIPENPSAYKLDPAGDYVEDLSKPGSYIHYSTAANNGSYRNVWEYLAENGVTTSDVS